MERGPLPTASRPPPPEGVSYPHKSSAPPTEHSVHCRGCLQADCSCISEGRTVTTDNDDVLPLVGALVRSAGGAEDSLGSRDHRVPFVSAASQERDQRHLPSNRLFEVPVGMLDSHVGTDHAPRASTIFRPGSQTRPVGRAGGVQGGTLTSEAMWSPRPREPERAERLSDPRGVSGGRPPGSGSGRSARQQPRRRPLRGIAAIHGTLRGEDHGAHTHGPSHCSSCEGPLRPLRGHLPLKGGGLGGDAGYRRAACSQSALKARTWG